MLDKYKELKELHDCVTSHPYRLNFAKKYEGRYRSLLLKLTKEFFKQMTEHTKYGKNEERWWGFHHDFNSAILCMKHQHIELLVHLIHQFLITGSVPVWYTYYSGSNILNSMNRLRKWDYDEKMSKFIPIYTEEELENSLKEIEKYWKTSRGVPEFGRHAKENYEYYKEVLQRMRG